MSIGGLDSVKMGGGDLTVSKTNILDKDDFLYLLVTQLKSQNPLEPMENTEFTAQLSQFSSLEQLRNINENIEYLQLYQASINNSQAVSFIGKNVKAAGNSIQLNNGVSDDIHFELAEDANAVFLNIYDSAGNLVKAVESGALSAGEQTLTWDSTNDEGHKVPDGIYTFEVLAADANDEMVGAKTFTTGKVTGVTFKNGATYLVAGNQEIPIGDVIQITETEN